MLGVFVDTETSGLDPFLHVPIDLGIVVVDLSSGEEKASYETLLSVTDEEWHAKDPNSAAIHGITYEQLKTGVSLPVTCDGCAPGTMAKVVYRASQAEYTPPVIYSVGSREKLLYRVELKPEHPTDLPLGLPVDVELPQ